MARIEQTVFISYRREDGWAALSVFKDLKQHGYDVFIDYDGIASGDFERAIVDNIRARAHFLVLLTPSALKRCNDPKDWLRREIEVAISAQRNIVPMLFDGFSFQSKLAINRLQGSLAPLSRYQALTIPGEFFDAAMERLRSRYLAIAVEAVLHPPSLHAQQVAQEQQAKAEFATEVPHAEGSARVMGRLRAAGASAVAKMGRLSHVGKIVGLAGLIALSLTIIFVMRQSPEEALLDEFAAGLRTPGELYNLGMKIESESGGREQDFERAMKLFRPAADAGHAPSQVKVGNHYTGTDTQEAAKWYLKAAEQGYASGQFWAATMYRYGHGVRKDSTEAIKLYHAAAEQGDAFAQFTLGQMYEFEEAGLYGAEARAEAIRWYRMAAVQNHIAAGQRLAYLTRSQ